MLWKLYFWAMAIAAVLGLIGELVEEPHEVYPAADGIFLAVSVVQLLGLFGYVYRKPLLSAAIWRRLFAVFVIAFAAVIVGGYRFSLVQDVGMPAASIAVAVFALPLFFPLLLANYRYAFRCQDIWFYGRVGTAF